MSRGIAVLLILASTATPALAAEIYTWTDADGIPHFSNERPATDQDAKIIIVEPPPPADDPAAAHARTMQQLNRQREAVEALRRAQNPPRGASSRASPPAMSAREYEQARQAIHAAWQRKEINKSQEAALYLDLERKRLGLTSNHKGLPQVPIPNISHITGRAYVIDGDTVDIDGTRIRLYGIDAVERSQHCARSYEQWPCGQQAAAALKQRIGSPMIQCRARDRDSNDRMVAACDVAGEDLSAWMVRQGWAVAYTRYSADYVSLEKEARALKRNIWSGTFVMPEAYRHSASRMSGK